MFLRYGIRGMRNLAKKKREFVKYDSDVDVGSLGLGRERIAIVICDRGADRGCCPIMEVEF